MANERILVVDDEPNVVHACARILSRHGYLVTGKTDSRQVAELLRQETFDLLLTDIKMPGIDGLELLHLSKEIDPHLTVVIITGFGTMDDAIKAMRLGASGFLMKPFRMQELLGTVQDSLARRNLLRDSLNLQYLLPLLEINEILQAAGGERSLVQQVLVSASRSTGAARLAWINYRPDVAADDVCLVDFEPAAQVSVGDEPSRLPTEVLKQVATRQAPVWMLADGSLVDDPSQQPNVVGAVLPLLTKGQVIGLLTAECDTAGGSAPFGQMSLSLLSILATQLAIVIENVRLFQHVESLNAFNENIIQNMTNGLIATDSSGRVTAMNPAAAALLGQKPEHLLHKPLVEALPGAVDLVRLLETTRQSGVSQGRHEITIQSDQGESIAIAASAAPLSGSSAGVVGVIEDLSEIKALEAEHRRLDRLAALGEMSAVVAHEIRNPIAGISAGVEYLSRNAPPGSPEQQGAELIQSEIDRVNRIVEDILFVARPLQLNLVQQPLAPIVATVVQRNQAQLEASQIHVVSQFSEDLPELDLDGQRLEQVFSNLINNAVQAMAQGGQINISATAQDGQVIINVSDTGSGIAPDLLALIFDPFYTTKTKGTGLGLSVARRIIEAHRGTIAAESQSDQGTRFTITVPAAAGDVS